MTTETIIHAEVKAEALKTLLHEQGVFGIGMRPESMFILGTILQNWVCIPDSCPYQSEIEDFIERASSGLLSHLQLRDPRLALAKSLANDWTAVVTTKGFGAILEQSDRPPIGQRYVVNQGGYTLEILARAIDQFMRDMYGEPGSDESNADYLFDCIYDAIKETSTAPPPQTMPENSEVLKVMQNAALLFLSDDWNMEPA